MNLHQPRGTLYTCLLFKIRAASPLKVRDNFNGLAEPIKIIASLLNFGQAHENCRVIFFNLMFTKWIKCKSSNLILPLICLFHSFMVP